MTADLGRIHPTAVIESGAVLAEDVRIGPFCYVGDGVELGSGSVLLAHACVLGPTRIGKNNRIYPYAVLGAAPQDRTFSGEASQLLIGDENVFREQVTVHRGTAKGGAVTRIGSHCWLLVGAHVAHDCLLEDGVVLTNLTSLAGHVQVEAGAVCGGYVAVAPFARLGSACFVAGGSRVERDIPPFVIASGDRARVRALNRVGLERAGVPISSRQALKRAFRMIWRSNQPLARALPAVRAELGGDPYVLQLLEFMLAGKRPHPAG
jgi:UDP-N-acetylglucosamine acyltransferase